MHLKTAVHRFDSLNANKSLHIKGLKPSTTGISTVFLHNDSATPGNTAEKFKNTKKSEVNYLD